MLLIAITLDQSRASAGAHGRARSLTLAVQESVPLGCIRGISAIKELASPSGGASRKLEANGRRTVAAAHVTVALMICEQADEEDLDLPVTLLRDALTCLRDDLDYLLRRS